MQKIKNVTPFIFGINAESNAFLSLPEDTIFDVIGQDGQSLFIKLSEKQMLKWSDAVEVFDLFKMLIKEKESNDETLGYPTNTLTLDPFNGAILISFSSFNINTWVTIE